MARKEATYEEIKVAEAQYDANPDAVIGNPHYKVGYSTVDGTMYRYHDFKVGRTVWTAVIKDENWELVEIFKGKAK